MVNNKIGNKGAKALANGKITGLKVIDLQMTDVSDKDLKALTNGNLKNLKFIDLEKTKANGGNDVNLNTDSSSTREERGKGWKAVRHRLRSIRSLSPRFTQRLKRNYGGQLYNGIGESQTWSSSLILATSCRQPPSPLSNIEIEKWGEAAFSCCNR